MEASEATQSEATQLELKKQVMTRMKRIEGQVRGIQRMIDEGKECEDILVQVRAVRSALQSANKLILQRYLHRCYSKALDEDNNQTQALEKVINVLGNFLDG